MKNNHLLGLYVSYYLARFNEDALRKFDYPTWTFAFRDIGEKLQVNKHSVKNWRDEFDPLFGHRVGWYQKPLGPSRMKVAQALERLTEPEIRRIVKDILSNALTEEPDISKYRFASENG